MTEDSCLCRVDGATLCGEDGLWDLHIEDGRVKTVQPAKAEVCGDEQPGVLNVGDRLVLPGFVDAHVHLDKAYLLDRCCAKTGDFTEALEQTMAAKRNFSHDDIVQRARRMIENAIAFGTTLLRTHAEVDHVVGLTAVQALLALRDDYAWALTIQVAAFAQEGITNVAGCVDLLRKALEMGCDVIGSAPYCDPDPIQNICQVFDLAQKFNCAVDFHLDYHLGDEKQSHLHSVLQETIRRGWERRVCLGHMCRLSSLDTDELQSVANALRQAGVAVLALPASDIYMMARGDSHDRRRGVCPVHILESLGVCASFASNNVQNLFTFTGDGDMLKVATLTAQLLQLGSRTSHAECLQMATSKAAHAIGVSHSLNVGCPADLVVLDCSSPTEALAAPPVQRTVIKRGRVVARTTKHTSFFKSCAECRDRDGSQSRSR